MKKLRKKDELFMTLLRGSQENDTYSVAELCRKMGISYEQIKQWAYKNEHWGDLLEICHMRCVNNVEIAAMMRRIPMEDALKYRNASCESYDDAIFSSEDLCECLNTLNIFLQLF